jgi:hypothetical protein
LKSHFVHASVGADPCVESEFVSAKRIMSVRLVTRVRQDTKIAGLLVVVQDRVLVELA